LYRLPRDGADIPKILREHLPERESLILCQALGATNTVCPCEDMLAVVQYERASLLSRVLAGVDSALGGGHHGPGREAVMQGLVARPLTVPEGGDDILLQS
jgi:hypothetical protein